MAKTFRRAVVKRSEGGRVVAARFTGRCTACGTEQTAEVAPREFVRLRVVGKTCAECNPARDGGAAGEAPTVAEVWWDAPNGEVPRWETSGLPADEPRTGNGQTRRPPKAAATGGDSATGTEWLAGCFEPPEWRVIVAAWRPESCDVFVSLGAVLKRFWSVVAGGAGAELVVRLTDVPALAAVLVPDLLARSFESQTGQHLHTLDDLLRRLGILLCAGTGRISGCGGVRAELGRAPVAADRVLLDRPEFREVRTKIAAGSPLPPIAELLGLRKPAPRRHVTGAAHREPRRESANALTRARERLERRGESLRAPAVFGS